VSKYVECIAEIRVEKAKVGLGGRDVLLAPANRWPMNIHTNVAARGLDMGYQPKRDSAAAATDVKDSLIGSEAAQQLQAHHLCSADGIEVA
jgi:hypothetical protein